MLSGNEENERDRGNLPLSHDKEASAEDVNVIHAAAAAAPGFIACIMCFIGQACA